MAHAHPARDADVFADLQILREPGADAVSDTDKHGWRRIKEVIRIFRVNPWLKLIPNPHTVVCRASSKVPFQPTIPDAFPARESHRGAAR